MAKKKSVYRLEAFWRSVLHFCISILDFFFILILYIMPKLSLAEKRAAVELRKAGLGTKKIATQLNFSDRAIRDFFRRYAETGDLNRKSGSGRPRKSTTS